MKNNLKQIIIAHKISQKELAEKTGITQSAISRYVNSNRIPSGDHLLKIAEVLKICPKWILKEEE